MTTKTEHLLPQPTSSTDAKWVRAGVWVSTGLFAIQFALSGTVLLLGPPEVVSIIHHLGYPDYFRRLLGFAKLVGVAALVFPLPSVTPREWAYAGCTFTCIAASVSHAMSSDSTGKVVSPLVSLAILATSYVLRHRVARAERAARLDQGAKVHG